MSIEQLIAEGAVVPFAGGAISCAGSAHPLLLLNPRTVHIEADTAERTQIIILHNQTNESSVELSLSAGAQVVLTDIYLAEAFAEVNVRQSADSRFEMVAVQLRSANAAYRIDLTERRAECEINGVFLASDAEHCTVNLTTRHMVPQCTSRALVKGVAGGRATGEFRGLVYGAPNAQQTDAQQQSRNIELDGGHIVTMPQLEIYADDVRCSHGATVGQLDDEAVFYMRQRGLSETDARRLQIEGFVNDIVNRCPVAEVRDFLMAEIAAKLENL